MTTTFAPASVQRQVLVQRYAATLRGDWGTVLVLLAQAPLIGWLCTLVWASVETDTPSLRFVLSLSAVWFGCINACREIVKERPIVERERLLGLSMVAYVASRFQVIAALNMVQVILLQGAVEWQIALRGNMLVEMLALWLAANCGTGLGLLVSAASTSQERAVGVVPLLLLPQILFSSFVVPSSTFTELVAAVEKLMPVHWGYRVFEELSAKEPSYWSVGGALLALCGISAGLVLFTWLLMLRRRPVA